MGDRDEAVLHAVLGPLARVLLVALGVAREGGRDLPGRALERGREEERLPVLGCEADDPVDRGAEAHVEHPVRFVEHQYADGIESDGAALHEVLEAAGCGHQDVCPSCELRLALDAGAAVYGGQRQRARRSDLTQIFRYLARQLPRRDEHEGGRPRVLGLDAVNERDAEGEGLPRACRRLHEHVVSGEHVWNDGPLDIEGSGHAVRL